MARVAAAIAVIRDDKILLTRRDDFEVWCLPGGGVDPGEFYLDLIDRLGPKREEVQVGPLHAD